MLEECDGRELNKAEPPDEVEEVRSEDDDDREE